MTKHTVLVVDDERTIRELMISFLVKEGYEVLAAQNAREAMRHIEREELDLILLDIRLPDASGEDVLDYLRGRERIQGESRIPVIVISGVITRNLAPRLIKRGADGLVVKPFEFGRISNEIRRVLEMAERWAETEERKSKALKTVLDDPGIEDVRTLLSRLREVQEQIERLDRELEEYAESEVPASSDDAPVDTEEIQAGLEEGARVSVDDYAQKLHRLDGQLERKLERRRLQKEGRSLMTALKKVEAGIQNKMRGLSEDEESVE